MKDKFKLIREITLSIPDIQKLSDDEKNQILQLLVEREKSMTTGIGNGVAIPHITVPFMTEPEIKLVLLKHPMDFAAVDRKPVRIVILLLVPGGQFNSHIHTLSAIARLLYSSDFRQSLLSCSESEQALKLIRENEL